MNLSDITPLILTFNEEANIARCLERLCWASRIVLMDSGSTDRTLAICKQFPNVEVVYRAFDSFAGQCNAGLERISSDWVLSLDSDYVFPEDLPNFLAKLGSAATVKGFRFPFRYCIHGSPLRSCLYPPRTVLYLRQVAKYQNDGHGHRVQIDGPVADLPVLIDHDDRKPLSRWLDSQRKYAALEADKLSREVSFKGTADRLRKMIWPAAPAAFFYTLFVRRLFLDGRPGLSYALQRTYAELLLSLELLERKLAQGGTGIDE
jgi:glycosyltransferase involved in cell wall biosynthesis